MTFQLGIFQTKHFSHKYTKQSGKNVYEFPALYISRLTVLFRSLIILAGVWKRKIYDGGSVNENESRFGWYSFIISATFAESY